MRVVAGLFLVFAGFAPPAWAQGDWDVCKDEKAAAEVSIAACTRLITDGKVKGEDLAITYYNRAISYRQQNNNEAALADYNDSIRINPKYAKAFNNRGNIWKFSGEARVGGVMVAEAVVSALITDE